MPMKHLSLATRYRPQRFDEVAGQDLIKAVLSRASAEDRVASGYLLSGTRGVGKTTIARIFAKALNCEHAPCAEPCNACEQCRRVTAGTHPDVVELDGASNNTVDDARALRETVGFAPMEGRYKIFIIDEAHMLTRNAFNALLKTLEEPPQHVVFIFATTELFRFPATILSRCQVFSFRHLSEDVIAGHLGKILGKEDVHFEDEALHLIARRAAGSARDSMSLLDQVLAYDRSSLTAETVRTVLGLAGQDALAGLFAALQHADCAGTARFSRELVTREIDIGFFLRELADNFRSLFLLTQCDRQTVAGLGVSDTELDFLEPQARLFSPTWLHAAWQMVLNSQRQVSTSPNPASALELLLMNLALLPRLLPASKVPEGSAGTLPGQMAGQPATPPAPVARSGQSSQPVQPQQPHAAGPVPGAAAPYHGQPPRQQAPIQQTAPYRTVQQTEAGGQGQQPARAAHASEAQSPDREGSSDEEGPAPARPAAVASSAAGMPGAQAAPPTPSAPVTPPVRPQDPVPAASPLQSSGATTPAAAPVPGNPTQAPVQAPVQPLEPAQPPVPAQTPHPVSAQVPAEQAQAPLQARPQPQVQPQAPASGEDPDWFADVEDGEEDEYAMGASLGDLPPPAPLFDEQPGRPAGPGGGQSVDMEAYRAYVQQSGDGPAHYLLSSVRCVARRGNVLVLECDSETLANAVRRVQGDLQRSLGNFLGEAVQVDIALSAKAQSLSRTPGTPPVINRPELKYCFEILKAHVDRVQRR